MKKYSWLLWSAALCVAASLFVFSFLQKNPESVPFPVSSETILEQTDTVVMANTALPEISDQETSANSFLFVGDVMLGRYVETLMDQKGSGYPWEKVRDLMSSYEMVIANLEGPIVVNHTQTPNNSLQFSFDPSVAQVLAENSINAVSLANNHTFDQGEEAFADMGLILDRAAVGYFGHPQDPAGGTVFIDDFSGDRLLLVVGFHATSSRFDIEAAVQEIQDGRKLNPDDFVVVSVHWGSEYQLQSNARQQEWAHRFIDAGADLVIGHHPHVVQEIELYDNHLIFYSLGNFIFDQYFSEDVQQELAMGLQPEQNTYTFTLLPLQSERSQPRPMDNQEAQVFLENLAERSHDALSDQIKKGIITLNSNVSNTQP